MKIIFYILILFISNSIFAQIVYEPVFINQCTQKEEDSYFWWISDSSHTNIWMDTIDYKSVTLSKSNKYNLFYNIDEKPLEITIPKVKLATDTFFIKRINLRMFIYTPPHIEYYDCDSIANGKIIDYYYTGTKRAEGVFKDGQLIDTIVTYFRNGNIEEVFIPEAKNWKRINYYEDGKIKTISDTKKRYSIVYYRNGQIKEKTSWSKKNKESRQEYFQNGNIKAIERYKKIERYDINGFLSEKINRKEKLKLQRFFAKKTSYKKQRIYNYKWTFFGHKGSIERIVSFDSNGISMNNFPEHINQIENYMYKEIIYLDEGNEYKRIKFHFEEENVEELKDLNKYFIEHRKRTTTNKVQNVDSRHL